MKYATFDNDGKINGRYDSVINSSIPQSAVELTDAQFAKSITDKTGYYELVNGSLVWSVIPLPQTPDPTPTVISMRQARQALYESGLLDQVNTFVASIPGSDGDKARIAWEYAGDVEKTNPLVIQIAAALPLTDQQVTDLFVLGATL